MKQSLGARKLNNILIVDDTPQNLHLLVDILSEYDYKVRPVPNGKLALSAIEISPPDLILLDIMMPGLDGYQVCKQLKSNPKTKDIPVIFISAMSEPVDKVKAFSVGGADYITKPFQMHEVLVRIKNQLAISSLQHQLKDKNKQLYQAMEKLNSNRKKAIESQKHSILEQVTSGIKQQVDSPLEQIDRAVAEIEQFGTATLRDIPAFLAKITPEQQKYFIALLIQTQNNRVRNLVSAEARRKLKTKLIARLTPFQLPNTDKIAEMLIELGADEDIESFLPFLTSENYWEILDNAYLLLNLHKSVERIAQSSTQVSKTIAAFQKYTSSYNFSDTLHQANIKHTIENALGKIAPRLTSGIQIIKHYSDVPTISCYPKALQQLWTHLIKNAVEAIGSHGILTINLYQQQNNAIVDIVDTGKGIDRSILDKLSHPFFTTKTSPDNMGLGLAIAKQIVERHNGKITVDLLSGDRTLPGNTKFTVALPLDRTPN